MAELLPCPFCGGSAKFISFVDKYSNRPACLVRCNECGALTKDFVAEDSTFSYKDEAEMAWNTRTTKESDELFLENVVDLDKQTAENNAAMRKVMDFMKGE